MPAIFEKYRRLPAPIYILALVRPIAFALALSGATLLYVLSLKERQPSKKRTGSYIIAVY